MKKFSFLALVPFLAAGLIAQGASEVTFLNQPKHQKVLPPQEVRTGQERVALLRKNYLAGDCDAMLANLETEYQKMVKEGRLSEWINMRTTPLMNEKEHGFATRWEEISQRLIQERNEQLQAACKEINEPNFRRLVDSVTTSLPSDQQEALRYLSSLRFKTPDQAIDQDEKKLIELDLASEFKILQLIDSAQPLSIRTDKEFILKMDLIRHMQEAAQSFQNQDLKKKVAAAAAGLDAWQARNWDLNQLKDLAKHSTTDLEKKIASILSTYKTKESDLYKEELAHSMNG